MLQVGVRASKKKATWAEAGVMAVAKETTLLFLPGGFLFSIPASGQDP